MQSVVASSLPVVVASVVASGQPPHATTDPPPVVASRRATTDRPGLVWRIEINRRPKADGTWSYHWLYRFGSGRQRRSEYGGTIDQLMALNPARWLKYLETSNDTQHEQAF